MSINQTCYQLISTKVDAQSVINYHIISWVDNTCDGRPLVYHSNRQVLFTARFCRAGPLAQLVLV